MGDAVHFLERMNRLNDRQSDLAIFLYKNPIWLRLILREINPPASCERVAIAMASGTGGPHMVITRTGGFITCLGAGMRTGNLYVISRERFDVYFNRLIMLAQRREAYWRHVQEDLKDSKSMDELIFHRGACMSREDFMAASVLQPVMKQLYIQDIAACVALLRDMQQIPNVQDIQLESGESMSELYWNCFFATGHWSMLASMFGPKGLEPLVDWNKSGIYPFYAPFHTGQMMNAARALFAAARMGKYALQVCEKGASMYHSVPLWLFSVMGAVVIGCRHRRLMRRVKKIIAPDADMLSKVTSRTRKAMMTLLYELNEIVENPSGVYRQSLAVAQKTFFVLCRNFQHPTVGNFKSAADVPDDLAFGFLLNKLGDFRTESRSFAALVASLVWISRADAEELYLPKRFLHMLDYRWTPEWTNHLIACDEKWYGKRGGNQILSQFPGRNDVCVCGSGRKFKKCCMPLLPVGMTSQNFNREGALENISLPVWKKMPLPRLEKLPLLQMGEWCENGQKFIPKLQNRHHIDAQLLRAS